jgi:hypothetical protein
MLLVVVLLPLSLSMYNGEFGHGCGGGSGGGGGGGGGGVAAVEDSYQQKRPAMRALTVT